MAKVDLGENLPVELRHAHVVVRLAKHTTTPGGGEVLLLFGEDDGDTTAFVVPSQDMPDMIRDMTHAMGKAMAAAAGGNVMQASIPFPTTAASVNLDASDGTVELSFDAGGVVYTTRIQRDLIETLRDGLSRAAQWAQIKGPAGDPPPLQ